MQKLSLSRILAHTHRHTLLHSLALSLSHCRSRNIYTQYIYFRWIKNIILNYFMVEHINQDRTKCFVLFVHFYMNAWKVRASLAIFFFRRWTTASTMNFISDHQISYETFFFSSLIFFSSCVSFLLNVRTVFQFRLFLFFFPRHLCMLFSSN